MQQLYLVRHVTLPIRQALHDALCNGQERKKEWRLCVWQNSLQLNVEIYIYTFEGYLFKLAGLVIAGSWCACTDFYIYYMKLKVKVEN